MTHKWTTISNPLEWDKFIAESGAHPMQSALWDHARCSIDQIKCYRYSFLDINNDDNKPLCIARVETRTKPGIGKIAWIPKGSTTEHADIFTSFIVLLKEQGFKLIVFHEYKSLPKFVNKGFRTIWINLKLGKETLYNNLDKQWRYGVNRARREGVKITISHEDALIQSFYTLCAQLSEQKSFELPNSLDLIHYLVNNTFNAKVSFTLFSALINNEYAAGAVVARCGDHIHYFWGASDRKFSKQRPSEAVQWAIIEWALDNGCSRYDLEGIDPVNNPGVYAFKKKMGGQEVYLPSVSYTPLSLSGKAAIGVAKIFNKLL